MRLPEYMILTKVHKIQNDFFVSMSTSINADINIISDKDACQCFPQLK